MYSKFKLIFFIYPLMGVFLSCSNTADKSSTQIEKEIPPVVFSAIGDVPYGDIKRAELIDFVEEHNTKSNSEFIIHLGDIKAGKLPCDEYIYADVDSILQKFKTPTFIIVGDNEFNDCKDPVEALSLWKKYFLHYNENWSFDHMVKYQEQRVENFTWVENKVLFIGINLVGGRVHDKDEWEQRLTDNGNFIKELLATELNQIEAAVVFAHANIIGSDRSDKFKVFTDIFLPVAKDFNKPILFLNGDGHTWIKDKPWPDQQNVTRVQVEAGAIPLQITVDVNLDYPFIFKDSF